MNKLKTFISISIVLGITSCATVPSASSLTPVKQSKVRSVILDGETYSETDLGEITSWSCNDYFDGGKTLVEVGFFTSTDSYELGFILYDGSYTGETTNYGRKGINHRWDWGEGGANYAFIVKPDGKGLFYDFAGVPDGEKTNANEVYKCHHS